MLTREKIFLGENINNIKLRVTYYARVSTDTDEQLNSLENQTNYFENYIKENNNWTYIPGYIDEGLSGSTVKNRYNFLRMIEDAKRGLFDLIITKEVSRFSRNLSDSIKYTQMLLQYNVGVYFQTNGINTFDPNSEFILNMMGSVAQEEVKRLSLRVKWGHKNAIKRGRILGSNNITGYQKNNGKLTVDENEAIKVRKIFTLYASGKYGLNKLARELYRQNITNSNNNIYDKETLKRILENPKYKGYYRGHTTEIIDYRLKRRIIIPKNEQLIYKDDSIPQIVSEELWEEANQILRKRSTQIKGKKIKITTYPYTNKLFCKEHNSSFYRKISRKEKVTYSCNLYLKNGVKACYSPIINEDDLNSIIRIILNNILWDYREKIEKLIIIIYEYIMKLNYCNQKYLKELTSQKKKILELYINNNLSQEDFKIYNDDCNKKINNLKSENHYQDFRKIRNYLSSLLYFEDISKYIDKLLNKIIISCIDKRRECIRLEIYLKIKQTVTNFLYNSKNKSYYVEFL